MVHIPAGDVTVAANPSVHLDDLLIDKYEVTNRDFKKFVDAGGYREPNTGSFPSSRKATPSPSSRPWRCL